MAHSPSTLRRSRQGWGASGLLRSIPFIHTYPQSNTSMKIVRTLQYKINTPGHLVCTHWQSACCVTTRECVPLKISCQKSLAHSASAEADFPRKATRCSTKADAAACEAVLAQRLARTIKHRSEVRSDEVAKVLHTDYFEDENPSSVIPETTPQPYKHVDARLGAWQLHAADWVVQV